MGVDIKFVSKRKKAHNKKKEAKPKLSGEKNVSTKVFRVLTWFKV